MRNVTDRRSNPFGMEPPCERRCSEDVPAVYGFGDANADLHVIGDHPGVHGAASGVPFVGTEAGAALRSLLATVGLLADPGDAETDPEPHNVFLSYLHMCCPPEGEAPSPASYADLERFFDAELRAIAAHVLVPVGRRATAHVLESYTARSVGREGNGSADAVAGDVGDSEDASGPPEMDALHATEVRGSGWLVFPLSDPAGWSDADREAAREGLAALLARDYRQTTDLGRFLATDDPYLVR